jgi:hypothetical protein
VLVRHNLSPIGVTLLPEDTGGQEGEMATLYFHCVGKQEALIDRSGSEVDDLYDARARAFQVIQSFVKSEGPQDWREWTVHISDHEGEELLLVPFTWVLGRPH